MINKIHNEDCLETMKRIPDEFINCVVTSPPYWGLRDYGVNGQLGLEKTLEEYVAKMVEIFREIKRVLKKDGTVWINLGDSYAQSGSGIGQNNSVKSNGIAIESFRSAKYLNQKNPKTAMSGLKPKDLIGIPWRVVFALQANGWYLRQDIIWHKPNPMPESVTDRCTKAHEYIFLLTKSAKYYYDADAIKEESIGGSLNIPTGWDISDGSHNKLNGRYDHKNLQEKGQQPHTMHKKRAGYSNDVEKAFVGKPPTNWNRCGESLKRNKRSVWTVTTQPYSEAHFATFPEALIEPMILAGCPEWVCIKCGKARERIVEKGKLIPMSDKYDKKTYPSPHEDDFDQNVTRSKTHRSKMAYENKTIGWTDCGCETGFEPGIVYDPFMGAGTTAKVALRAIRQFIGSELKSEYCDIANKRIESLLTQKDLFYEMA